MRVRFFITLRSLLKTATNRTDMTVAPKLPTEDQIVYCCSVQSNFSLVYRYMMVELSGKQKDEKESSEQLIG